VSYYAFFKANLLAVCAPPPPFPLSVVLGTLADDLGSFPLVYGPYRPQADSRALR
jgi:hypothetical protein